MANPIKLRKNINIGAADAESDDAFLAECFQDTGDLGCALDCKDPKCIVIGRTGVGKTALLKKVITEADYAKELSPETLALNYISNSNVLKFFEQANVKLDVFYQLLWRHIFVVELIKLRFNITSKQSQDAFLTRLVGLFAKDQAKERAFKYLQDWGSKFWEETEYRTKEFTHKLETDLKASTRVDAKVIEMGAAGAQKLSEEEKIEVYNRATTVVNSVQIKELHDVIDFLAKEIFTDNKQKFFLVLDRLDEDWVEDQLRFKLLKALIETIKSFRKIECVKIIIAMRTDLHYHLFRGAPDSGFQEEKYKSLYLPIRWTREQLVTLLDERVRFMFKRQYTRDDVKLNDILPKNQIDKRSAIEYIIDRTFFRPREAIIFLNHCIAKAEGSTEISIAVLRSAEVAYSLERLDSLAVEWAREYPLLKKYLQLLRAKGTSFQLSSYKKGEVDDFVIDILTTEANSSDPIYKRCEEYYRYGIGDYVSLLEDIFLVLYQVGLIGVKPETYLGRQWSYQDQPVLPKGQIKADSFLDVHKTFWAALGLTPVAKTGTMKSKAISANH